MIQQWMEAFRNIAICAWWFDLMVGAVALGLVTVLTAISAVISALLPKNPMDKTA